MSYYVALYLMIQAFKDHQEEILEISGRQYLRLRSVRCDFEYAIHEGKAFWGLG